ncbi:unnamed protein product [Effrenium voratum]|uniref:Integrase catalytic domain-containing protein n=1 Tax=Effrenium voratum TaxID=2562239 RepID=A0AA36IZJ3_9DINO|nr:unnamed protein product [Effrenium voratum]
MVERADERASWVLRRVSTIFAVRREKLDKFLQIFWEDQNSSRTLDTFLNEVEVPAAFFHLSANGDSCSTSTELPTAGQMKKKVLALVRSKHEVEIEIGPGKRPVVFVELAKGIMDLINSYCHSVYLSVLMNPANQRGWSDLISRDLIDKFHSFLATLHVTVGLMKGQTLLPLPPREAVQDGAGQGKANAASKDRVHVLEGAVITWTKQVRYVLKQEPEHVFREGNPQPDAELQFWRNRANNLNSIHMQLQMEGVKRVLRFLEANKSTYVSPFARLQKEVEDSREEANDNVRFLKTLEPFVNSLLSESVDFEALERIFDDIFHMLLLIWRHSKYYNSLARLAVIVRQLCNSLIAQATRYISSSSVFEMILQSEAHECHDMLENVMRALESLQESYHNYRALSEQGNSMLGKDTSPGGVGTGWRLRNTVVFGRLEAFGERVSDILDFVKTVLQFNKLERVDIGGTKGKVLSKCVEKVHEEFEKAVEKFRRVPYDIFDVKEMAFISDFHEFRLTIRDLDRRLGSILAAAFHDQDTLHGRAKLLDAFEGLLERPVIQAELVRKQQVLINQYKQDVDEIQANFTANEDKVDNCEPDAPIFANLPPVAGAIFWARSLRTRLLDPMPKIVAYNELTKCEVPESFKELERLHRRTLETLHDYEQRRYSEWKKEVGEAAKRLHMRLLRRHDRTGLLKVNFDPALVRLLREVRFFLIYGLEVPREALTIYSMVDTYRTWTSQLDHIVGLYNSVLTDLLPVEEPLLEDRILKMDTVLAPGLTELKWSREDHIPDFIAGAMKVVSDVSAIVDIMKGNLRRISNILSQWCKESMLERKRGAKPVSVEEFEQNHKARVGVRLMNMTDGGKEIHRFVKDSSESLKISKTAPTWKAYVDFVNNVVIEGFVSAIAVSLQYLCEILDPLIIARHEMLPLFDVKIELQGDEIVFDPPFEDEDNPSRTTLRSTIDSWLKDFFAMATVMVRLDSNVGDYLNEIKEHFQMQCLLSLVSELIDNTESKCLEYRENFMSHSFLWTDSVDKTFERFLQDKPKELVDFSEGGMRFRDIMTRIKVDLGPPIPSLERFDKEVARFEHLKQELSLKKTPTDIHWLRIDAQPVKVTLVNCARKWEEKFTGFLRKFVEDRITSLSAFITSVRTGLGPPSAAENPEDERLLYQTMTKIRDVKLARGAMQRLFQPLREQVQMLKKHHCSISEESWNNLEHAPAHWAEVDRAAFNEKEKILPLQNQEMVKIRGKIEGFREDVRSFRAEFLERCPFGSEYAVSAKYDKSYAIINKYHRKTMEIRARAEQFNDLELLFDMAMSDYRPLNDCLSNLVLLKNLWDLIVMVRETFSAWYNVLWDKIDTGQMMATVRELSHQVKSASKGMRAWPLYSWLQDEVKNMSAALPLVNELHSDTMRDRHWAMLMAVTKKTFEKGPEFSFRHLLELELHHFSDVVYEIVDQSVKEAKIEAKLEGIRKTWSKMTVEFDNNREDCPLLADLSEVLERLESDSLEMLSMTSQGRFIEFCKQTVDEWSEKLQTVDSVLQVWGKFQINWCRLEPIFMQSDDIRSQLPEDSKRFEMLDNSWKDLMIEASRSSLIVEICMAEGRAQTLADITDALDTCERSLNDYLEQKKKSFPRFYFVANGALLDILSNGNKPLKVAEYLGDVFDGIRTLDFSKDPQYGRMACGHRAKDGEFVAWPADPGIFVLEGPVEQYLAGLESHVRLALREILEQARTSAESWELGDRPRETWLDDYCAQLSLLATQVIWTEETTRAFEDMEAGSETAMKDYKRVNDDRIEKLIRRVQRESDKELRTKVITIITIDVHSRDVIESFVLQKVNEANDFRWGSQLRFYWTMYPPGSNLVSFTPAHQKTCVIKICDWATCYAYEYVGNVGRLVITPLTDRCYITLTQALNLCLGGAPAGPAGTGKTETTKDLSRALGLPIVVFNCSDQMTYQTTAQIFMGLAQVGAWGCFDEFNRISIEVLSVVSTQYKSVLDAIRANSKTFLFVDEELRLVKTCGAFITMNPGYAGRTELPENLKALFRSVAMIVPNLKFICENMLMSEGFIIARLLAHKFVTLYSLSKELLSKQMHYDWGLRAVKSLLRQAGSLKGQEPETDENIVLCRALRDFNLPKITTQDMPIFQRLISDLFPGISPEPFLDLDFRRICEDTIKGRGLQPDPGFVDKVVDFLDILKVRHCCFIIGPTGAGKTEIWRSLEMALIATGEDCRWEQVNPKAITADELYGTIEKGEWKDGAIAVIMRSMSKELNGYKESHKHKWVVLDGDIDATWIESMNTVMDDNKVLTLVSNERIPFTPSMRMLLEIQDMKHASPATVSRGGVLYINETDVGWKPFVESWREQMDPVAQSTFYMLFTHQFEGNIEQLRKNFAFTCPILDMGFVQTVTCLLDALLEGGKDEGKHSTLEQLRSFPTEEQKAIYESFFTFALMWALGGAVADDKIVNHRKAFSATLRSMARGVKLPETGECFDYHFEVASKEWAHWETCVKKYEPVAEVLYQNIVISNVELERMKHLLDLHVKRQKPMLLVGVAGTAKTTITKDYLAEVKVNSDTMNSASINLNSYTTSAALQSIIVGCLEKRSGHTYGPPGRRKCILFVDDLNMPYVDDYDTQSAIMLLTQVLSYGQVYDRERLDEKKNIVDLLFTACMNPKAGSFMINGRLQRRFTVATTYSATASALHGIYTKILGRHLQGFGPQTQRCCEPIVNATAEILASIQNSPAFLPSAEKFHYQFNLKDIANIFQGMLSTNGAVFRDASGSTRFLRVWLHELHRVFSDRLVLESDAKELQAMIEKAVSKCFVGVAPNREELFALPNVCTAFISEASGPDRHYLPAQDMQQIRKVVEAKLEAYNNEHATMNLVLFDDAVFHVCRICRITGNPCGSALLVGVGGSGKQSLARLASFINGQEVLTILVNQQYGLNELKADLQEFYKKAAVKPANPQAFLLTDSQITDERFLVFINVPQNADPRGYEPKSRGVTLAPWMALTQGATLENNGKGTGGRVGPVVEEVEEPALIARWKGSWRWQHNNLLYQDQREMPKAHGLLNGKNWGRSWYFLDLGDILKAHGLLNGKIKEHGNSRDYLNQDGMLNGQIRCRNMEPQKAVELEVNLLILRWMMTDEEKLSSSKALARWAPGMMRELARCLRKEVDGESRTKVKALSWEDRPHRRVRHPAGNVLSVDLSGPFIKGIDVDGVQDRRYLLVAAFTWPQIHTEEGEELREDLLPVEEQVDQDEQEEEEGFIVEGAREEDEQPVIPEIQKEPHPLKTLYMTVPLKSKDKREVLAAIQEVYIRLRREGHLVLRLHSDKGGEFMSKELASWCRLRDIRKSTRTPDQMQENGRAEAAVGVVKSMVRRVLIASRWESKWWPCIARYVSEVRFKFDQTGDHPKYQFGEEVVVPKRAWKQKSFEAKNQRGKYLAPLYDITHGHAVKLDCDNKVVAVSKVLSGLREGEAPRAEGQEEEENPDGEALFDEALRVRRRLRMKTSDPRRMDDGGGEKVAERIRLLRNLIVEEEERMLEDGENAAEVTFKMVRKLKEEEENLKQTVPDHKEAEKVLHTKMVSTNEVIADKEAWATSIKMELDSLMTEKKALRRLAPGEAAKLIKEKGNKLTVVPGKAIFSVKAGSSRRKTRLVVCGNYVAQNSEAEGDTFAGGTDIAAIRLQVKDYVEELLTRHKDEVKKAKAPMSKEMADEAEAIDSVILGDSVEALITDILGLDDFKKMLLVKELCALWNLKAMREEDEQSRLNKAVVMQPEVDKWIKLLVILIMITGCRAQGNQQPEEEKIDLAVVVLVIACSYCQRSGAP